eukprot:TRINITY_DN2828_c0_g1_i8.p1 TRINITY_DN2828_c0_g1~~TRINITY_DN2828_c0_g1_i8.p1  ORF type:complete len:124 (-),score=26.58 TRINITY_DN2828_c0_g1_i8:103-474(-)
MLSTDLGMYLDFQVGDRGQPIGCPGLDAEGAYKIYEKKGRQATKYVGGDTGCDLNRNEFDGEILYQIVEDYAVNTEKWYVDFPIVLKKMLTNGYSPEMMTDGPNVFDGVTCRRKKGIFQCTKA